MTKYVEKPTLLTLELAFPMGEGVATAFTDWKTRLHPVISSMPGFVSLEFLALSDQRKGWLIVQRFASPSTAQAWKESIEYKQLIDLLKEFAFPGSVKESEADASQLSTGVTEVIVVEIHPGREKEFCEWCAKMHEREAAFPGFRGVYVQSPQQAGGKNWITLLQFDTLENLDRWLGSTERGEWIGHGAALIRAMETQRVISPYAGWFASIARTGEAPSLWQQTMLVLLVLFPIVMLELKYLSPLTARFDLSLATFIGNAISVSLISFPMMPLAIWCLGWWLSSSRKRVIFLGTLVVLLLYLIEIAIFWNFI
jgi:antibiotic biosynthesis monooxygenase (ABM) superfamily enzyme